MGRYIGPTERISRRIGINIFDKHRSAIEKAWRQTPPGMHGFRRARASGYRQRLVEKQKLKFYYGLRERQFLRYFAAAMRMEGNTGTNLLSLLERRLDNAVFKAGFAPTHRAARQMVVHGHIHVNGRKLDRPSYQLCIGDQITIAPREVSQKLAKAALAEPRRDPGGSWLAIGDGGMSVSVTGYPIREDVYIPIDEQLVVEFCNR